MYKFSELPTLREASYTPFLNAPWAIPRSGRLNKASLSKIPPLSQSHSTILPLLEPMPLEPALLQAS